MKKNILKKITISALASTMIITNTNLQVFNIHAEEVTPEQEEQEEISTNCLNISVTDAEVKAYVDGEEIFPTVDNTVSTYEIETGKKVQLEITSTNDGDIQVKRYNPDSQQDEDMNPNEDRMYELDINKDEAITVTSIKKEEPDPVSSTNTVTMTLKDATVKGSVDGEEIQVTEEDGKQVFTVDTGKDLIFTPTSTNKGSIEVKQGEDILKENEDGSYTVTVKEDVNIDITSTKEETLTLTESNSDEWVESIDSVFDLPIIESIPGFGQAYQIAGSAWKSIKTLFGLTKPSGIDAETKERLEKIQQSLNNITQQISDIKNSVNELKISSLQLANIPFKECSNKLESYVNDFIKQKEIINKYAQDYKDNPTEANYKKCMSKIKVVEESIIEANNNEAKSLRKNFYDYLAGNVKVANEQTFLENYMLTRFEEIKNYNQALEDTKNCADRLAALYIYSVECELGAYHIELENDTSNTSAEKANVKAEEYLGKDGKMEDGTIHDLMTSIDKQINQFITKYSGCFIDSNNQVRIAKDYSAKVFDGAFATSDKLGNTKMLMSLNPYTTYLNNSDKKTEVANNQKYVSEFRNYIATNYTQNWKYYTLRDWLENVVKIETPKEATYLIVGNIDPSSKKVAVLNLDKSESNATDMNISDLEGKTVMYCAESGCDDSIESAAASVTLNRGETFNFETCTEAWQFMTTYVADCGYNYGKITFTLNKDWVAETTESGNNTTFSEDNSSLGFKNGALYLNKGGAFLKTVDVIIDLNGHTIDRNLSTAQNDGCVLISDKESVLIVKNGTLKGGYNSNGAAVIEKATKRLGISILYSPVVTLTNVNLSGKDTITKENGKQTYIRVIYGDNKYPEINTLCKVVTNGKTLHAEDYGVKLYNYMNNGKPTAYKDNCSEI